MAFSEGPFQAIRSIPSDDDPTIGPGRYFNANYSVPLNGPPIVWLSSERNGNTRPLRLGEYGALHSARPYMLGIAGFCVTFVTNGIGGYLMNVYNRNLRLMSQTSVNAPGEMTQIGRSRFILRQENSLLAFQIDQFGRVYLVKAISDIDVEIDGEIVSVNVSKAAFVSTISGGLYIIKYVKTKLIGDEPPPRDYSGPYGDLQRILDELYPPEDDRDEEVYHAFIELSSSLSVLNAGQMIGFPHKDNGRLERTSVSFFWYVQGSIYRISGYALLEKINPQFSQDIRSIRARLIERDGVVFDLGSVYTVVDVTSGYKSTEVDESVPVGQVLPPEQEDNLRPTGISLSTTKIEDGTETRVAQPSGALRPYRLAVITSQDPNQNDRATYSIVGGADASKFSIGGTYNNILMISDGIVDITHRSYYSVILRVRDSYGLILDKQFIITVEPRHVVGQKVVAKPAVIRRLASNLDGLTPSFLVPDDYYTEDISVNNGIAFIDSNGSLRVLTYVPQTTGIVFNRRGRQSEYVFGRDGIIEVRAEDFEVSLGPRKTSFVYAGGSDPWRINLAPLAEVDE